MSSLTFASHLLEDQSEVISFHFQGTLDFYMASKFEQQARFFQEKGYGHLLLDFTQINPDASPGMWEMLAANLRLLKNARMNMKVAADSRVLEKLMHSGESSEVFNLAVFPTVSAAMTAFKAHVSGSQLHHFQIEFPEATPGAVGVPFHIRIKARDARDQLVENYHGMPHLIVNAGIISPALAGPFSNGIWQGQVMVTSPGPLKIRVREQHAIGENTIRVEERGQLAAFPIKVSCPGCDQTNIAGKNDVFRCMTCNEIYYVDPFGHVLPLKEGKARPRVRVKQLDFIIPSDVNYLNHVRNFIVGVSSEEQIGDEKISQVEMSLDEALANIIEHAYTYDASQEIHIRVLLHPDRLEIVLKDYGRSFDSKNLPLPDLKKHIEERKVGGLGRYLITTLMDEVEYQSDAYTNTLRMVKFF